MRISSTVGSGPGSGYLVHNPLSPGDPGEGKVFIFCYLKHTGDRARCKLWLCCCFKSRLLRQDSPIARRTTMGPLKMVILDLVLLSLSPVSSPHPILQDGILMHLQKQFPQTNPALSCLWIHHRLCPIPVTLPLFCHLPTTFTDLLLSSPLAKCSREAHLSSGSYIAPIITLLTHCNVIFVSYTRPFRTDTLSYLRFYLLPQHKVHSSNYLLNERKKFYSLEEH